MKTGMKAVLSAAFAAVAVAVTAGDGNWGTVPLGEPGDLKLPEGFVNQPSFRKPTPFAPGLKLFGDGVKCVIVAPKADKYLRSLADEFAWHLSKMCGETFELAEKEPANDVVRVVFENLGDVDCEQTVVLTDGRRLLIAGAGAGASHGLTHVLEALGCRYLWPGESGKVIPKRKEIVLPKDIDIAFAPRIFRRGVRDVLSAGDKGRNGYSLRRLGLDTKEFSRRLTAAHCDRKGNRGFWQWHGVNDLRAVPGGKPRTYAWGHYFGDYVDRYQKDHPDWFALQPDGSRTMQAHDPRPNFCLSNAGLAEETISNLVATLRKNPGLVAASACLPDGGSSAQCMCEACRRLDPPNGVPSSFGYSDTNTHQRVRMPYPAITDRVLTFMNRVAAGVDAVLPGKGITYYCYLNYEPPPVKVRPHPGIVLYNVAGDYTRAAAQERARRSMAAWSAFGNELFWRPNVLRQFGGNVPQNYARRLFEDVELFKANHLVGTDFDCMNNKWAVMGLDFYMLAKALVNAECRGYDDLLDDYCRSGFGAAAADVKEYFAMQERLMERVVGANDGTVVLDDGREVGNGGGAYRRAFDTAGAEAILARAEKAAAGDAEVLRRIRFLRFGLETTRYEQFISSTFTKAKLKENRAKQQEYLDFFHRVTDDPDALVAVNPMGDGFYNNCVRAVLVPMPKE